MEQKAKLKRFIDVAISTETCNLRCHYCYIAQHRKFNNKIAKLQYSPKEIRKALSIERLGGVCMFNFCAGGETLIAEEIIDVVKELLEEGHYVMIVTNGTLTQRFQKIAQFPRELMKRLFFKFSFHYLELIRLNLLDTFFNNINLMKEAGASFTVEITPNDELVEYIDEIKKICYEKLGVLCHITIGRRDSGEIPVLTNKPLEEYKKIWNTFESPLFEFKSQIFSKKRKEFCYAGEWTLYLDLVSGDYRQCYGGLTIGNIYKNIDKPLKTLPIGNHCTQPHCYNGHAFLTFGCIPELDTPTYDKMRNRINSKGEEWLSKEMKEIMQCKLKDSNKQYSSREKRNINLKNSILNLKDKAMKINRKVKNKIKGKRKKKNEKKVVD